MKAIPEADPGFTNPNSCSAAIATMEKMNPKNLQMGEILYFRGATLKPPYTGGKGHKEEDFIKSCQIIHMEYGRTFYSQPEESLSQSILLFTVL